MTVTNLFGVALAPLYAAIADVESDNGKTSGNVYQISVAYIADVNRITKNRYLFAEHERYVRWIAESMMAEYWKYYGERYARATGKQPTAEVLARIHNGGPDGWRKEATLAYWRKVEARIEESPARGVESQVPRNGEAEGVRTPVGRESVAQEGKCSNTAK